MSASESEPIEPIDAEVQIDERIEEAEDVWPVLSAIFEEVVEEVHPIEVADVIHDFAEAAKIEYFTAAALVDDEEESP